MYVEVSLVPRPRLPISQKGGLVSIDAFLGPNTRNVDTSCYHRNALCVLLSALLCRPRLYTMGGQISQKAITGTCVCFYTSNIHFRCSIYILDALHTYQTYYIHIGCLIYIADVLYTYRICNIHIGCPICIKCLIYI